MRRILCGLVVILLFARISAAANQRGDSLATSLRAEGIEPTADGVAAFFRSLSPNAERSRKIAELIDELGAPKFEAREAASAALAGMLPPPVAELTAAKKSADPEIRSRAEWILGTADVRRRLLAERDSLEFMRREKLKGFAPVILKIGRLWDRPAEAAAARRALVATARAEDADLLREVIRKPGDSIADPPPSDETRRALREAAVTALATAGGANATTDLTALVADRDARIQLAAARGLADLGRRESLAALVQLLDADDVQIRARAHAILRELTHEKIAYLAYDEATKRQAAVANWKAWLAKQGETAPLHLPLAEAAPEVGHILIGVSSDEKLREIDANGKTVFEGGAFTYVWGCWGGADGHRLAVDYQQQFVVEFDADGRECWRRDNLPGRPTDVSRLETGNTLVALSDSEKVIELAPDGKIVWELAIDGRPTTAQRLANGNTLVNLQGAGEVVEVDRDKKIVWRLGGMHTAHTAQALENGNILVCEMQTNKAIEYDRSGKVVWLKEGLSNPAQAQRIPNGHTLIADEGGLHEFDEQGHETWHFTVSRSRFCRF